MSVYCSFCLCSYSFDFRLITFIRAHQVKRDNPIMSVYRDNIVVVNVFI